MALGPAGDVAGLGVAAFATSIAAGLRARRADQQRREVMENVGLLQAGLRQIPAELAGLALSVAYRPAEGSWRRISTTQSPCGTAVSG